MRAMKAEKSFIILTVVVCCFLLPYDIQARKLPTDVDLSEESVRQRWLSFEKVKDSIKPQGEYPYRTCFERTAEKYDLPLPLLLAVARGESNFNKDAKSIKDCYGVMQIQWPGTAKYLGITRKTDLFNPCINIEAGGRYMSELLERFDGETYLALAAYNYGPNRIQRELRYGGIPEGARWYAAYIYSHLEYVRTRAYEDSGRVLVLEPNKSYEHALRMQKHFEAMTKEITFEIFRSDHYTYNLFITYKPGQRRTVVKKFYDQTAITPIEIRRLKGDSS